MKNLLEIFRMIKIEHTVFALPFALVGVLFAAGGWPGWRVLGLVVLAMYLARSAAMAFNRLVDQKYDAENPRTADRSLPAGRLKRSFVILYVLFHAVAFIVCCGFINKLALVLSPVALAVILGYSLAKRFTSVAHLILGLGLAIAPAGGWIAVRGELSLSVLFLCFTVLFWVAGFDILYALQDRDFDANRGLHSIPVWLGVHGSLNAARLLHVLMIGSLVLFSLAVNAGLWFNAGILVAAILLIYEHSLVRATDLSRLDAAFFQVNSILSVLLLAVTILRYVAG